MSISALTTGQSSTISLITGTTQTQSASASELMTQGQGIDEARISKGGQQMKALSDLAAADPGKFKEAAQGISEALAKKAGEATDSAGADALQEMADKWAEAAESGQMPAFEPPAAPPGGEGGAMGRNAALKYRASNGSNPMEAMDPAVSGVLSGLGIKVDSASTGSGGAAFTASVSSASSTTA